MPLTDYSGNLLVDALFRGGQFVAPATYYVALLTTMGPTNALAGVEVVGGAYARSAISASLISWSGTQGDGTTTVSIGTSAVGSNNATIQFPQPSASWGQIVGIELWDGATIGNRWFFDVLDVPMVVSAGDPPPAFPPGTLRLSFV